VIFNTSHDSLTVDIQDSDAACHSESWHQWPDGLLISRSPDRQPLKLTLPPRSAWVLTAT
jgi:hypothetical protein